MNFYVYAISVNNEIKYIGKGSKWRMNSHIYYARRLAKGLYCKAAKEQPKLYSNLVESLNSNKEIKIIKIAEDLSAQQAAILELREINRYSNHQLWNAVYRSDLYRDFRFGLETSKDKMLSARNKVVNWLGRYVDEFAFRLNEGDVKRHTLDRLASFVKGVAGKRLTYKALIA